MVSRMPAMPDLLDFIGILRIHNKEFPYFCSISGFVPYQALFHIRQGRKIYLVRRLIWPAQTRILATLPFLLLAMAGSKSTSDCFRHDCPSCWRPSIFCCIVRLTVIVAKSSFPGFTERDHDVQRIFIFIWLAIVFQTFSVSVEHSLNPLQILDCISCTGQNFHKYFPRCLYQACTLSAWI